MATAFRQPIPINAVGVGSNAFAHESGIHADGMLKDRSNYELYSPDELGISESEIRKIGRIITTGEYGGLKDYFMSTSLGIELEDERETLRLVQYTSAHNQRPLNEDELRFIAEHPAEVEQILTVTPNRK